MQKAAATRSVWRVQLFWQLLEGEEGNQRKQVWGDLQMTKRCLTWKYYPRDWKGTFLWTPFWGTSCAIRVFPWVMTMLGWAGVGVTRPPAPARRSDAVRAQTSPRARGELLLLAPAHLVSRVNRHLWLHSGGGQGHDKGVIPRRKNLQRKGASCIWHLKAPLWSLLSVLHPASRQVFFMCLKVCEQFLSLFFFPWFSLCGS